jgi:hypothetical protein
MPRPWPGPRRSDSVESYLQGTRVLALVAVLALLGGIVSDTVAERFWERHALLAGLAASVTVVMLSVAIVNEALELRRRRRWRVLAQYVMLQLVGNARSIWTGVAELAALMPSDVDTTAALENGSRAVRDTPRLTEAVEDVVAAPDLRRLLQESIGRFMTEGDELLGRWAAVMLNADAYAELIDRHVELASELFSLDGRLNSTDPSIRDGHRRRSSLSHPALQIEGDIDDQHLVARVVAIAQLAEELDRLTLEVAGRIVPVQWWGQRLGTTPPAWTAAPRPERAERPPPGRFSQ